MEVAVVCLTDTVQAHSSMSPGMLFHTGNLISELVILQTLETCVKKKHRRGNYFVEVDVPRFSDFEFKSHFRMSLSTVEVTLIAIEY